MSGTLRGKNIFDTTSSGFILDTVAAAKTIDLKTAGVSRLLISDSGVTFSGNVSVNRIVEGYLLINTSTSSYAITTATPKNLRIWGTTPAFTTTLPLATSTTVGTSYTIYNTSTVQIGVFTNSAGLHTAIESNYSATFVLIDAGTDAVASWKIVCEGVPSDATTGYALVSNGSGALPTYQNIYATNSFGTWTPVLAMHSQSASSWSNATTIIPNCSYVKTRVNSTVSLVHISMYIYVSSYLMANSPSGWYVRMNNLPYQCSTFSAFTITVRDIVLPVSGAVPVSADYTATVQPSGDALPPTYDPLTSTGYEMVGYGSGLNNQDVNNIVEQVYTQTQGDIWTANFAYMTLG